MRLTFLTLWRHVDLTQMIGTLLPLRSAALLSGSLVALGLSTRTAEGQGRQPGLAAQRVAGCYAFDRSWFRWYVRDTIAHKSTYDSTHVLRLTTELRRSGWPVAFTVLPVPAMRDSIARERWRRFSYWALRPIDSLVVIWQDGYHGHHFRLAGGDSLQGTASIISDVVDLDSTGRPMPDPLPRSTRAVRVACPRE